MVQRKLPSKLDHIMVNSKPLLASLKPSSLLPQHQDVKKKKKMKKSGKTTTFENFRSPPLRRSLPPPPITPPQKQQRSCPVRASPSSTPNYMKSTSSSDARKERSPHKSSSGSKSGQNPARALARTTSLRALTKTPSFKPARASTKKCSQVVLCEDLDVQRATCSSTLKDSKFPCYLELSPGGTESQGTSAMKVCPYTYCSLNGHHRLPLPPLKCFVSARRRSLKAQRSFRIGCLSPRRAKPSAGEENMDFSIEIYCKERADEDNEVQENRDSSAEEGEDIHPASMVTEELRYECLSEEDDGSVANQSDSEDSDMEGMEDSALYIDAGVSDSICHNEETDLDKNGCHVIQDESILKIDNNYEDEEEEEETVEISDENILQKSFDEESMSCGAWLSDDDDDTQSSISCLESSSFCEYVEESPGCNQHNEDENETTQVSDEEICIENMIPPEDDEAALTEHQESNDSNDSICNDCVQEVHNVEEELMVKVANTSGNETADLELPSLRRTGRNKRETEEDELREFNPRGPNFLPLEPDPEAERVSLKHQSMDERKNGEEWMVDYALRQAVSKLAPARRKKVALLVEAFETVSPIPKYESHLSHTTKLFPPPSRSIQACS